MLRVALLCFTVAASCTSAVPDMPWADPAYEANLPATTAESREGLPGWGGWIPHHENRKKWVTEKPVELLFVGDSILFEYRRSAHPVWEEFYGNRKAENISSSGDQTSHMLWHFQNGGLDGMKDGNPKAVVLLLGTNNRGRPENAGADTAAGILALLKEIHARLPGSKIVLMALLPRGWTPQDAGRARNNEINGIIRAYADDKTVYWLDVGHIFMDAEGNLDRKLIKDSLHPTTEGYRVMARAMEPLIKKLLNE